MKTIFAYTFLAFAFVCGCGGDDGGGDTSGVDGSKAITDLSSSEVTAVCEWSIEVQGGAGTETDCGDGVTVTVNTQAECEAQFGAVPAACSGVTVTELEACVDALAADPCNFQAQACAEYFECVLGA